MSLVERFIPYYKQWKLNIVRSRQQEIIKIGHLYKINTNDRFKQDVLKSYVIKY